MRLAHGCPPDLVLVDQLSRFICSAHKLILQCTNRRPNMVENRVEYIAVSTGVVLTALVALIPFVA